MVRSSYDKRYYGVVDVVDKAKRSRMMAGIRGRDTKPELVVRRMLHGAGLRYRLHCKNLPGTPDLVLPKYRATILIHGCFWHAHGGCKYFSIPASNEQFWRTKLSANRERDTRQIDALRSQGWRVLVIWECATRSIRHREDLLTWTMKWLMGSDGYGEIPFQPPQSPQDAVTTLPSDGWV
nr:very short patch repair endonuclease [Burkholderia stabilis]